MKLMTARLALAGVTLLATSGLFTSVAGASPDCSKAPAALSRLANIESIVAARIAKLTLLENSALASGNTERAQALAARLSTLTHRQDALSARVTKITTLCPAV